MAIEAIRWLADGVYDFDAIELQGIVGGVGIAAKPDVPTPLRRLVVVPSDNLRMIRFLDGRIIFRYQDFRSLHWMTDTGEWQFYDPQRAKAMMSLTNRGGGP
jgi:hypothetical protein